MRVCTHRSRTSVRLVVAVAGLASAMLLVAAPASAHHCAGGGQIDDRGGEVVGECHGETPGRPGSTSVDETWRIYCADGVGEYREGDSVEFVPLEPLVEGEVAHMGFDPTGEYWWWNAVCWRDGERVYEYEFAVEETSPVPPEVIRDEVRARIEPPAPDPQTSPPLARETFVNVATWLWLDPGGWAPIEVSETRGLTTVTVRATPTGAAWVMGDGGAVTCSGPGVAWTSGAAEDDTDCSYTYQHSSYGHPDGSFEASVTVTWEFEWWINDVYQGVFGSVDLSTGFSVAVAEIQAVETRG